MPQADVCLGFKTQQEASVQGQPERAREQWQVRKSRAGLPLIGPILGSLGCQFLAVFISAVPSPGHRGCAVWTSRQLGLREGTSIISLEEMVGPLMATTHKGVSCCPLRGGVHLERSW